MATQRFCEKCKKTMIDTNFYQYKDGTKCELCKACLTMHVNNWEPDTFLWLLEKFDVPYIEAEWNVLRDRAYQKDPYKMTGMSVFGKYLAKMKLKQYNKYSWSDTEALKEAAKRKAAEAGALTDEEVKSKIDQMKEAYDNGEISEAQWLTYLSINQTEPPVAPPPPTEQPKDFAKYGTSAYPENSDFEQVDMPDISSQLTEEDKLNLAIKWGRFYKAEEWVTLENMYNEFVDSFGITGAARLDTLKKICKTSLKMDQAIDCGDIETYQKLSRVYDAMMKSAKFTEAQNKKNEEAFADCAGMLVFYCEKWGGKIPRMEIKEDRDIVDSIIKDQKQYIKSLVYEDKSLAQEIEDFLKLQTAEIERKRDKELASKKGLDDVILEDEDFVTFRDKVDEEKNKDSIIVNENSEEEEE